ncbi:hypothetical protein EV361DRAFT_908860 [Lentinula raphanica]|nr:hypothetical protein EV361DRAFT_908860 [Lentinula raphanica]
MGVEAQTNIHKERNQADRLCSPLTSNHRNLSTHSTFPSSLLPPLPYHAGVQLVQYQFAQTPFQTHYAISHDSPSMRLSTASLVIVVFGLFSAATVHSVPVVSLEARGEQTADYRDWSLLTEKAKEKLEEHIQKDPKNGWTVGYLEPQGATLKPLLRLQTEAEVRVSKWLEQELGPQAMKRIQFPLKMRFRLEKMERSINFILYDGNTRRPMFVGAVMRKVVGVGDMELGGHRVGAMMALDPNARTVKFPTIQDLIEIRDDYRASHQDSLAQTKTTSN